jgi:DNA mismatch endonuclease (patch repair protein)
MDNLTPAQRKKNMQHICSAGTGPERLVAKALSRKKIYFARNVKTIMGTPDIVFRKKKLAVFIDSCFWHACPYHFRPPKSNKKYWGPKIIRNKERDKEVNKWYRKNGWKVFRFWEHAINNDLDSVVKKVIMAAKNIKPVKG